MNIHPELQRHLLAAYGPQFMGQMQTGGQPGYLTPGMNQQGFQGQNQQGPQGPQGIPPRFLGPPVQVGTGGPLMMPPPMQQGQQGQQGNQGNQFQFHPMLQNPHGLPIRPPNYG